MKTIAARIREKRLAPVLRRSHLTYQSDPADIQQYQLSKFNTLWADIQKHVPYYRQLRESGSVPGTVRSWDDFTQFPILTRGAMQDGVAQFIDETRGIDGWTTTGGSTGTPFRVPYTAEEAHFRMNGAWLGRAFYDVSISDSMFQLWGHAHLFGTGWRRYLKHAKRSIKNWLLRYRDFSAYHLTPSRLRRAGAQILRMRPDYVMGYSRSLLLLAKANSDRAAAFHELRLKALIATTEAFADPGDVGVVGQVFGCPIAMEYGAAEVGVIAHTHPSDGRYRVFWDTFLLEAVPVNQTDAKLLLTTLYPRAMPLIRYDIGDTVRHYSAAGNTVLKFDMVLGRDNDLIETGDGGFVHPVALIHCIQAVPGVIGVQVVQQQDRSVSMNIMGEAPLTEDAERVIRRNLSTLNPRLGECRIDYVRQLEQTLAGKTRWIVRR